MPRWLRVLILFLMVLSLVIYISPLQVEASSIAASIAGVTAVNVPAGLVYAAAVIALGVAAGTNDDFVNMVGNAVSSAGDWVKDGTVELLQTVDTLGQKTYYVAGQMMEDLRGWLFTSETLVNMTNPSYSSSSTASFLINGREETWSCDAPFTIVRICLKYTISSSDGYFYSDIVGAIIHDVSSNIGTNYGSFRFKQLSSISGTRPMRPHSDFAGCVSLGVTTQTLKDFLSSSSLADHYKSTSDLTLATLPSQTTDLTDGSSARAWSETYTNNGLYVVDGGGSDPEPPDENNGKWFWPLAFTIVAGELYLMSQSDQWSGVTPPEFGDYETVEEFEILDAPEVEFGAGIEIAPLTSPAPGTGGDTGGDTGEDPETDPDTGGEVQTDYTTWFSRLYTTVENISGKFDEIKTTFQTWITDCKTAIEAIPSKFADWFTNIKTSVDTFASNAQDAWAQAIAGIQSLPASIADALANLMPEADPEQNPPSDLGNYTIDLKDFFPFCIPFDLYDFFTCLNADPVAPVIEWEIYLPGGEVYPLVLDLSVFDTVALLLRRLQLLLFCTGLAFKTRDLIRG